MGRDVKIFLLAVGIPALAIAGAGICLIASEVKCECARQEKIAAERAERMRELKERRLSMRNTPSSGGESSEVDRVRRERRPPHPMPRPRPFFVSLFSPEESHALHRILLTGGCMVGLLFLSFCTGGWLLVRSARKAREEALKKTDFISNVSHELKTPLTTICLCAELAQDEGLGEERRKKALCAITAEAVRLKGLVLQVLDFSRLEKKRRTFAVHECDVANLVREAAEPMKERFAAISLPVGAAMAEADPDAFKQIVVILLDNAAKYAAKGGPVEVSISRESGRVALKVADRGPGLDRDGLQHVFDRFWRGDNATIAETGGSGLGLSIARALARGMRGELSVAPRDGGGLVFTLEMEEAKKG